jgi:hypothetical protein
MYASTWDDMVIAPPPRNGRYETRGDTGHVTVMTFVNG